MTTRFSKHLGKGSEIEVDGEKYTLKPLDTESLPDFFAAMKAFSGAGEGASTAEMLASLTAEGVASIKNLIEDTLKRSFPEEWKADEGEVKSFGMKYMMVLLPKIIEINSADVPEETKRRERAMERLNASDKGQVIGEEGKKA